MNPKDINWNDWEEITRQEYQSIDDKNALRIYTGEDQANYFKRKEKPLEFPIKIKMAYDSYLTINHNGSVNYYYMDIERTLISCYDNSDKSAKRKKDIAGVKKMLEILEKMEKKE
jgi:hypothetical protein